MAREPVPSTSWKAAVSMPTPITPTASLPMFRKGNRPKTSTEKASALKELRDAKTKKAKDLKEVKKAAKGNKKEPKVPKLAKKGAIAKSRTAVQSQVLTGTEREEETHKEATHLEETQMEATNLEETQMEATNLEETEMEETQIEETFDAQSRFPIILLPLDEEPSTGVNNQQEQYGSADDVTIIPIGDLTQRDTGGLKWCNLKFLL